MHETSVAAHLVVVSIYMLIPLVNGGPIIQQNVSLEFQTFFPDRNQFHFQDSIDQR